jgi:hypothetical protein
LEPSEPTLGGAQTVYGASINGVEQRLACELGRQFSLERFLYLNTLLGFRTASGGVNGDELGLAQCFSGNGLSSGSIQAMVNAEGFRGIPVGCRSFDETSASYCNATLPATNSCANNPSGVVREGAVGEACGSASECASGLCAAGVCSL